jgi:hypothetical protein
VLARRRYRDDQVSLISMELRLWRRIAAAGLGAHVYLTQCRVDVDPEDVA